MTKTKKGRTTYHCDICDNNAFVGQVSGGTRDMCFDCYETKGFKNMSRVEIEQYVENINNP